MSIKFILCMTLLLGGNSYALYAQTMSQDSLTIEALDSSYYQNTFNLDDTHFEIGQVYRPKPAIVFQYNIYEILEKSLPILDSIANFLKEHPRFVVEVGNHKDGRGGDAYSRKITPKRAKKVVETLISLGVDSAQLIWMGYGDSSPIIPMQTIENMSSSHLQEKAHQKNRRTEFKILAVNRNENQIRTPIDIGYNGLKLISPLLKTNNEKDTVSIKECSAWNMSNTIVQNLLKTMELVSPEVYYKRCYQLPCFYTGTVSNGIEIYEIEIWAGSYVQLIGENETLYFILSKTNENYVSPCDCCK